MSTRNQLNSYIARVQRRLQVRATLRGLAILAATALAVTVGLVLLLNRYAFPAHAVSNARLGMFSALVLVALLAALPLTRLTRTRAVRDAERAHPHLEQRLTTFHQRALASATEPANPFLDLLAADTLARTQAAPPFALAPAPGLLAYSAAALAAAAMLFWTITSAPGFLGYGASLLWQGPKPHVVPLYALAVTPGDVAVRRNSDQLITAQLTGLSPEKVQLFARYGSAPAWEPVVMQPQPDAPATNARGYQFVFTGLPESVEYYVAAGPLTSPHYKVRVVDLPSVKAIRVTYHYPRWTGMKSVTEEHSGDLRAIEGTDAQVELEMDRPLKDGQFLLDDGHAVRLASSKPNTYQASIHMGRDGAYHVSATDAGQPVRLSEDYFIATDKALPPEVALDRPGRDYRASPIEEVSVAVKASGQFGLNDMHLHYSVNGGPDRDVPLLKYPVAKDASGSYTLRLEDFKLVPGDLVSLYATAKDGHAEARTDITFIQAEPFEREFSQSQQGGGGGGGGGGQQNNQTEISKREKELVAATWKQQNSKDATPKDAAAAGQFLADAQSKLRDQVLALSARMQSRDLSAATEEFSGFEKDMQTAAAAMAPSTDKLKDMQWKDALPLEQKALQALLHAEATFRQIQVAFGQQQGGGGGGGSSAGRDLASLFDLELDTAKNQYETAQTASPAEQHAKDVESALERLDALAKRQEELASNQHSPQQSFEQRWQQEMLRREAEQLQRQMEQLAKNNQGEQESQGQSGQQQSGQQQSGGRQQGSSSSAGQSRSQSASDQQASSAQGGSQGQSAPQGDRQRSGEGQSPDPRIEQALSRLQQASESMKRSGSPQQDANAARQAADRLRQAAGLLGQTQQQLASGKTDTLSREADRLTGQERQQAGEIDKLAHDSEPASGTGDAASMMARVRERNRLAAERQQLSNDLSKLQKNLRDSARETAANEPGVSQKLRQALTEMDQSDLDNHVQRTADWLRRGINPNSNGTEANIAKGLAKLNQQLREAQQASGTDPNKSGQRGSAIQGADQTAALSQVERLRTQLEAMSGTRNGQQPGQASPNGQQGQRAQPGGRPGTQRADRSGDASGGQGQLGSSSQQAGAQPGSQPGTQDGRGGRQTVQNGQGGRQQSGGSSAQGDGGDPAGQRTAASNRGGDIRAGGGANGDGTAWNNVNTGNNLYDTSGQPRTPSSPGNNPTDTERSFQQSLRELNQLRGMVGGDPQAAKDVADLARRMQQLDPKRFPGNPAMVEQLHREMLSDVDRLELQLQRADAVPEARTGKPSTVPAGYQESVADYYHRLSSKP